MLRQLAPLTVLALFLTVAPAAPLPKEAERPPLYYPVQVGARWVYLTDDRGGEETVIVTAVERVEGGVVVERSGLNTNLGTYQRVTVSGDGLRQTGDSTPWVPEFWLLRTPFQSGDKWDYPFGETRTANGPEAVTVPAGTFTAVRVEAKRADGGRTMIYWYVAGMGEVKRVERAADGTETVRRALKSFTPGKAAP